MQTDWVPLKVALNGNGGGEEEDEGDLKIFEAVALMVLRDTVRKRFKYFEPTEDQIGFIVDDVIELDDAITDNNEIMMPVWFTMVYYRSRTKKISKQHKAIRDDPLLSALPEE